MNQDFLKKNEKIISLILIFTILFSYFLGFYFQENSAGGAIVDFVNTKRNLITFKSHSFIESIKLTASTNEEIFKSTRTPGFYIFNKYFNPFSLEVENHKSFWTVMTLLIPLLFFFNLKIKHPSENRLILTIISSLILLSPYLRSSAFWGNEENFGILMVAFSALFFQLYLKNNEKFKKNCYLILLTIFSSLCVYADQKLIIIPIISFIYIIFSKQNKLDKFLLVVLYLIFSIPFIYLIKLWGNIVPTGDGIQRKIGSQLSLHHFLFSISIIAFYLFPCLVLINNKKELLFNIFRNKINLSLTIIFFFILIYFIFFFDLENMYRQGGGVFHKLSKEVTDNIYYQKFILSVFFIVSWILLLIFSNKNFFNFILLLFFPIFSLIISPALFQEYFDPLIYFMIFIFLDKKFEFSLKRVLFIFFYLELFLFISLKHYYSI